MLAFPRLAKRRAPSGPQAVASAPRRLCFPEAAAALSLPDLLVAGRTIAKGDEQTLLPEERAAFSSRPIERRRASAAARRLGRLLLDQLGPGACAILNAESGAPIFPPGLVGSFAHDEAVALAAVARRSSFRAVGVDVEPAEPLPEELWSLVATEAERGRLAGDPRQGRLLFAAKEAIYKAFYALEGARLDYRDIEVRLDRGCAQIKDGRLIGLRHCLSERVAVLAFLRARP